MDSDEYDRYLASDDDAPKIGKEQPTLTPEMISAVTLALEVTILECIPDINYLVITVAKPRQDGPAIWSATVRGITVMSDNFEQFIESLSRVR